MGGVPGVPPAEIVILGAGVVGTYAAQMCLGMGAHVTVIDHTLGALQRVWDRFPSIATKMSTKRNIERSVIYADVVIGAVLTPGQRAPILVTREMVRSMKPRSVIMDVSIDEGGCVETSRPTTHEHPVYVEEGILHYCVPNIPGAVARTATHAFVNSAMPYITEIAALGTDAFLSNPSIEPAINTHNGRLLNLARLNAAQED
jgi:alanine dehydrogenase